MYCWLSPRDQKIFSEDEVCLEIQIDENRCTVAEMDYISLAMMYKYGGRNYGGKNFPVNEVTSLPIKQYDDNFFTPEVLVKGHILPENIKLYAEL